MQSSNTARVDDFRSRWPGHQQNSVTLFHHICQLLRRAATKQSQESRSELLSSPPQTAPLDENIDPETRYAGRP